MATELPKAKNLETGLEEVIRPMLVVYRGTEQVPGPQGSVLEIVLFQVWTPDDWSKPEEWGLSDKGSHMAGMNFRGESEPVILVSKPLMVQPPKPAIVTARNMPPARRPRA